jgi:hypothetical protein
VRTPVSQINWLLEQASYNAYEEANLHSLSTAQLAALVVSIAHGLSGSKGARPNIKPQDFLPFADLDKVRRRKRASAPTEPTRKVLGELMRQMRLPVHVFTALITPHTEDL